MVLATNGGKVLRSLIEEKVELRLPDERMILHNTRYRKFFHGDMPSKLTRLYPLCAMKEKLFP